MAKDMARYIWQLANDEHLEPSALENCYRDKRYLTVKMYRKMIYDKVKKNLCNEDHTLSLIRSWDIKTSWTCGLHEKHHSFTYDNGQTYYISRENDVLLLDTLDYFNLKWKFSYEHYNKYNTNQWVLKVSWDHWSDKITTF
jgi:hypothetical protein